MNRIIVLPLFASLGLFATPAPSSADPVTYTFLGSCVTSVGEGCGAFGLEEGGHLSFEPSLAVPGDRLILNPSTVEFSFSFSFGDLVVNNANIGDAPLEVFFLPPDASLLNPLSAPLPPGVLTSGSKYLLLGANLVQANQVFALTRNEAFAISSWTRQPGIAPIPEPAMLSLLGSVVVALGGWHRRKRKT